MDAIIDDNFLGGKLTIVTRDKATIGRLVIYDPIIDDIIEFTDITICKPEDTFCVLTGRKIIRLKITQKYYKYKKRHNKKIVDKYSKRVNEAQHEIDILDNKLEHIQNCLKKFQ